MKQQSSNNAERKRRRNSDAAAGGSASTPMNNDSPEPSSIFPSSPAPFFSEAEYRNEAEEEDLIDNAFADDDEMNDSDNGDIDIFQDAERFVLKLLLMSYILTAYAFFFFHVNRDYADNERLDKYEPEGVDDQEYEPLDLGARNALDNNLNRRDVEIRRREGRVAGAFIYGLDDDANDTQPAVRRHRHIYEAQDIDQDEDGVVSF